MFVTSQEGPAQYLRIIARNMREELPPDGLSRQLEIGFTDASSDSNGLFRISIHPCRETSVSRNLFQKIRNRLRQDNEPTRYLAMDDFAYYYYATGKSAIALLHEAADEMDTWNLHMSNVSGIVSWDNTPPSTIGCCLEC